jgi:hypothetical protein
MNKNIKRISLIVTVLVAALLIVFIVPFKPPTATHKTTTYHTDRFDIDMEEVEGDYANTFLDDGAASLSYPSKQPWMLLHVACLKSDIRKKTKFLGVGNTLTIGTIWQKDFKSLRTCIDSVHFDPALMDRITKRGKESSCGTSMQMNSGVGAFLNVKPAYFENINGELGVLVKRPKKTTVYVESFVPVDLLTGDLITLLDTSRNQQCKQYLHWFCEEGNLVCTWTYEVTGVSIFVETEDTISTSLKAQLQDTIRAVPITGKLQTSYTYVNNRTIKITTHNPFYAVGGVQRIARVKERKKK